MAKKGNGDEAEKSRVNGLVNGSHDIGLIGTKPYSQ